MLFVLGILALGRSVPDDDRFWGVFATGWLLAATASIPAALLIAYLDRRDPEPAWVGALAYFWGALVATGLGLVIRVAAMGPASEIFDETAALFDTTNFGVQIVDRNVLFEWLETALAAPLVEEALKARVDAAVEEGRLTEEQGVELKKRIDSGEMPFLRGIGTPGPGGYGHFHRFAHFPAVRAAADYLGLEEDELRERLRDGDTLAEIAKAEGKPVDGLVDALAADAERRLDDAVSAGKLTRAQADELADRLAERMTDLVNGELPKPRFGFRHGFDGHEHPFERRARNA